MRRHALVSQTRFPEIDRDTGSQRVDMFIEWLVERDWSVTFLATESDGEVRHAHRLRQLGIPTYVGPHEAEGILSAGDFDLALLAFWEPASRLLPILRTVSPQTRVVIDSIDVHFLRTARRIFLSDAQLDAGFGWQLASELNAYRGADAVLTVSSKEARLLGDFLSRERVHELPLADRGRRSSIPFEERSGLLFVGNFRHPPNGEAVEFLCHDVLPRVSPELLSEQPVYVVGSRMHDGIAAHGRGMTGVRMVGWVPSVVPYLDHVRACVVPLLHGAGVKGKVLESLMAGTPVVTTTIGAEGLGLSNGDNVLIADTADELANALAHVLTDGNAWQRLSDSGYEHAAAVHSPARVAQRFEQIVEGVLSGPPLGTAEVGNGAARARAAYHETLHMIRDTLRAITAPGASVLVVSRGDDALVAWDGRRGAHFPQGPDGGWAGFHPADSDAAIEHLDSLQAGGARYFVLPSTQFWWLHHYRDFFAHLDEHYRRIFYGEHLIVYDLAPEPRPAVVNGSGNGRRERVFVLGTYAPGRGAPPARLVEELGRGERFDVRQRWLRKEQDADAAAADADAEWILHVDANAVLPAHFVDEFMGLVASLSGLGVERAQPAHMTGPEGGPPVTERLRGVLARELAQPAPLPVLAVRAGAERAGPTALVDAVPIGLATPPAAAGDPVSYSDVLDVFTEGEDGPWRAVRRTGASPKPRISVLVATYDRPALLAACLEGFCEQTWPDADFEVVVVDDGSTGAETERMLENFAVRLPLTYTRIEHSGRSAAKNLAVLLARGDLVLFFDDDDRPAPDLLEVHVRAHARHPDEATAILGHTGWDPALEVSPLMHYLTEVDRMLFAYGNFEPGDRIDWRGFWEGRVSAKRSLLVRHGLHDQRLEYSIDVELAWRLRRHGLEVVYQPAARSVMSRPITFEEFCRRYEAKGRAQATIASLHDHPEIREYTNVDGAPARWALVRPELPGLARRIADIEQALRGRANGAGPGPDAAAGLTELHRCYRKVFFAHNDKGVVELLGEAESNTAAAVPGASSNGDAGGGAKPQLSVIMPVWSRTPELADMALRTATRLQEVATLETELIVIDNASPVERPFPGKMHRFEENRGVASAWNTGIRLAAAPVIAVLNSDCLVEPGWDEALYEAATTGRRIAFPYTDHCDGEGFRQPDQAGTAGWCFMLTRALYEEIGAFDERFSPAYGEDTDYWHRAWDLGVELSPVPAARVTHARRSSVRADDRADWLLLAHRYKYGWKHGVDPLRAPPYYNREIVEYHARSGASQAAPHP